MFFFVSPGFTFLNFHGQHWNVKRDATRVLGMLFWFFFKFLLPAMFRQESIFCLSCWNTNVVSWMVLFYEWELPWWAVDFMFFFPLGCKWKKLSYLLLLLLLVLLQFFVKFGKCHVKILNSIVIGMILPGWHKCVFRMWNCTVSYNKITKIAKKWFNCISPMRIFIWKSFE